MNGGRMHDQHTGKVFILSQLNSLGSLFCVAFILKSSIWQGWFC